MRRDHGGLPALADGTPLLDFSASINPLGLAGAVEEAMRAALPAVLHYPDPEARPLRRALAEWIGLPSRSIVVGHGASELLYLATRALLPRRALIVAPAFSEYEAALESIGCRVELLHAVEEEGFRLDPGRFGDRLASVDLAILANPANPTGVLIDPDALAALARRAAGRAVLLVDESFIDFAPKASMAGCVSRFPGLLVLRSLTKFFAIPGLRIGYALAGRELAERLRAGQPPWPVNAIAGQAALAALRDEEYQRRTRRLIPAWRADLASALAAGGSLKVFPSAANFLLLRILKDRMTAPRLRARLLRERIVVRDGSTFRGLGPAFVRVAVRRPEENARLVAALRSALGDA